jgi:hypothetical protein
MRTADDFAKAATHTAQLAEQVKAQHGTKYADLRNEAAVYLRLAAGKLRRIAEATAGDEAV